MVVTAAALVASTRYAVIPKPVVLIPQEGDFVISSETRIVAPKAVQGVAKVAQDALEASANLKLGASSKGPAITFKINAKQPRIGEEGYTLDVSSNGIEIVSKSPAGAFYAVQTLRQLIQKNRIPNVIIEDTPRFGWRGAHLDCGRHFMPIDAIKRFIDTLALYKMNSFHWHLTEDQGWRIEIKRYPKLTEIGSKRKRTMLKYSPATYEEKEYGGFYTQDQAREIVAYAKARFINVVPEIEMPGHAQAAIAAYPELGNGEKVDVADKWGVITHVYNPEESTIQFQKNVLDEIMAIFPSKFIHIGGDECPKDEWKASPRVQQLMKERGLKDEHEMQSWFIRQIDAYLAAKGRRLIGWDEILEGGLAPGAAVMSWRGEAGGIAAAKEGHDVVMASTGALYFDYYQGDPNTEPHAIGGFLPLSKVYAYDMIPKEITDAQSKHILGGQFQLWTEYIRTPEHMEYMAWPRGIAVAEILWSPKSKRNFKDFVTRLEPHMELLKRLGVNARPLDANQGVATAEWKAGEVSNDYQVKTWDISSAIVGAGKYSVRFQYTSGGHRLDIEGVEFVAGDQVLGGDPHYGRSGFENIDNVWTVDVKTVPSGAKVMLRAKVRGDGGGDSNGEITVTRI